MAKADELSAAFEDIQTAIRRACEASALSALREVRDMIQEAINAHSGSDPAEPAPTPAAPVERRIECEFAGCSFLAKTEHGLRVHQSRKHRGDTLRVDESVDHWKDKGTDNVCDVRDGKCAGSVSTWTCRYSATTGCEHTERRCRIHRGDSGCKQGLGHHYEHHKRAGHDAPA